MGGVLVHAGWRALDDPVHADGRLRGPVDDLWVRRVGQPHVGTVGSTTTNAAMTVPAGWPVGSTNYTWNSQDQLTNVGSGTTYGYDVWRRLSGATVGSASVSYGYDALSRTLSRSVSGGPTTATPTPGVGQSPTSETVGGGAPTYYAWGASGPLAQSRAQRRGSTRPISTATSGGLRHGGVATGSLSYDPWGAPTAVGSDATASLLGYQSQPTDPTTGLVDMGARLDDPSKARFTTQDTLLGSPRAR